MDPHQYKKLYLGSGITLIVVLLTILFPGAFNLMERSTQAVEFRVRGESKIDSSIVVLYLNNDDIKALGGLPLKRNYYALIINVLHDLGARTIGMDIALSERDKDNPEFDELLANVVKDAGNVVLGGYFQKVSDVPLHYTNEPEDSLFDRFTTRTCKNLDSTLVRKGYQLDLPYPELLENAAAFGHTNLTDQLDVPLLIAVDSGKYLPAFGFAVLLRSYMDEYRESAGRVRSFVNIPGLPNGDVLLNYAGGMNSLNMFPVLNYVKEFDAIKAGRMPPFFLEDLRGKIVLLGVVAEGRGVFVPTPFEQQFPSIGIHATFIHNALHRNFLEASSARTNYLLILISGLFCTAMLMIRRERIGLLAIFSLVVVTIVVSFLLFSKSSYLMPTVQPIAAAVLVTVGILIYQHVYVRGQLRIVSVDKERITLLLEEKEQKLQTLEKELALSLRSEADEHNLLLKDEIKRYKEEITTLKEQENDLQPFTEERAGTGSRREEINGIVYDAVGPMREVVQFIKKIADSDATVLLLGESGTGKELVAKALHQQSQRNQQPFVAVNCGALTESLLESELFGHEKGSFTGALKEKPGRFELAEGGTIFLDEIAETSEAFQVKLLRVLQEGTYERVGGTETKKTNVRVIAATNRNIKQAVEEKKFREDLYYRLNIFTIQLPPLRERTVDIPLLAEYFAAVELPGTEISVSVMKCLQEYNWKGNIRELQSTMKRAVLLAKSEGRTMLRVKDLPPDIASIATTSIDIEERIIEVLRDKKFSRNSISETADDLGGLNRGTVAEYFRGYCFRIFAEGGWNISAATAEIAGTNEPEVRERVEKKLLEYLSNAIEHVDGAKSVDQTKNDSRPKYKNLPQRYHPILDDIITSYHRGDWSINDLVTRNQGKNA